MNVNIIVTPNFQREAKKLIKKYRSLKKELAELSEELEKEPKFGTQIGENVFKIRLAIKSKGKGKSGGARVITFVEAELVEQDDSTDVFLLSIYDKSDYENITESKLTKLVSEIKEELAELGIDSQNESKKNKK